MANTVHKMNRQKLWIECTVRTLKIKLVIFFREILIKELREIKIFWFYFLQVQWIRHCQLAWAALLPEHPGVLLGERGSSIYQGTREIPLFSTQLFRFHHGGGTLWLTLQVDVYEVSYTTVLTVPQGPGLPGHSSPGAWTAWECCLRSVIK